jgi:hypothetical protein
MWLAALAMMIHACSNQTIAANPSPRLHLIVRVAAEAGALDNTSMADVVAEASAIWSPYVDIEFTTADRPPAGVFDDQLTLVVRNQPLRRSEVDSIGLGAIDFQAPDRPARAITVSAAAVEMLAAHGGWAGRPFDALPRRVHDDFVVRALGRSVAHEIGHYLLRSAAHTHHGLMRPQFTTIELMDTRRSAYALEPAQIGALAQRIDARLLSSPLVTLRSVRWDEGGAPVDYDRRSSLAICASSTSARPCSGC